MPNIGPYKTHVAKPPFREGFCARLLLVFSLYNRGGFCYNVKDYDMIKGDTHEIFDRSDLRAAGGSI